MQGETVKFCYTCYHLMNKFKDHNLWDYYTAIYDRFMLTSLMCWIDMSMTLEIQFISTYVITMSTRPYSCSTFRAHIVIFATDIC